MTTREFLYIDLETRSACELRKSGTHRYFEDPTTEIIVACYALGDGPVEIWWPGQGCPEAIAEHALAGGKISGWNVGGFEKIAWDALLGPRHGWPVPTLDQYDDTAAAAAAMGLPRGLGDAARALGSTAQKDDAGHRLMLQMARPRRPRKGEPTDQLLWWEDDDRLARLAAYCADDVRAEREVRRLLVPLPPDEMEAWRFDWLMNSRGVRLDLDLIHAMRRITDQAKEDLDKRMAEATEGAVTACTQVARIVAWLAEQGADIPSLAKAPLGDALESNDLPEHVRAVLELRQSAAKSSTAKLDAMLACVSADGRARGQHLYHGASTGRWSGRLIQCVTGEHEVLTRDGWRRIDEAVGAAEIMCWRPGGMFWGTGEINRFPAPERIAVVSGTMIRGRYTPDHRMPNILRGAVDDWTPERLTGVVRRDGFLVVDRVNQPECEIPDDALRLVVSFQADGHFRGCRPRKAIWRFVKERKIVRLRSLLRSCGIPFVEKRHDCAPEVTQFEVDAIPAWLVKRFGPWVLGLSARQAKLTFEELAEWDGFRHQKNGAVCLMSPDKDQVEWMATVAALAGVQATLAHYPSAKSLLGRWALYERQSRTTSLHRREVVFEANDAPVYCPTVPGGYWLCRYGDRIYITGNTQNFPRGTGTVDDPETAAPDFMLGSAPWIALNYGEPMSAVSDMLRSCMVASPGHRLLAADFANIEGRVTAWLAGEQWKLDAFRAADEGRGPGLYELTASRIFNCYIGEVSKPRRQVGKVAELALGFAGGVPAFHAFAQIYNTDMAAAYESLRASVDAETFDKAQRAHARWSAEGLLATDVMSREAWIASDVTKRMWREKHPATTAWWDALAEAVFDAVVHPGKITRCGRLSYVVQRGFLWCRLPSGRCLAYGSPDVRQVATPWGEKQATPTALGVDSKTKKWRRFPLTRQILSENPVQAVARDCMKDGMLNCERAGYPIVLTVHDEAVADTPEGFGSLPEFERLLSDMPAWAEGLPVVATGFEARRYRK
ncbi:hypothetical protein [Thauera sp.]|uniref:hypothetical protein n=1 Tax=Thauera sp. TaxID=1905334 RepID=UPI002C2DA412|nr:hypothetical protein [Thauera sp.]HRP25374.1 hypothetical protein [Thauera sp.]